jgi:EamA domain-containing membrane protein RarD
MIGMNYKCKNTVILTLCGLLQTVAPIILFLYAFYFLKLAKFSQRSVRNNVVAP